MKVFVAVPSQELSRYPEFGFSLWNQQLPQGTVWVPGNAKGTYIADNQNKMAREFLASDCDYFWLVNDDQAFPADTLARLLAHKAAVVTPVCLGKHPPFAPLLYDTELPDGTGYGERRLRDSDAGLISVLACGGGGMLVKRNVMEALRDPWWTVHHVHPKGRPPIQMSEDMNFCRLVRKAGFTILCDTGITVGHIAPFGIWPTRDGARWTTTIERMGFADRIVIPAAR